MQNSAGEYCELCGSRISGKGITVLYEGSVITICNSCYNKVKKHATIINEEKKKAQNTRKSLKIKTELENIELEIVNDYYKLIKSSREKLGMTQQQLAQKLKVSENIIKRFESGKLKPTISQARQLEKILGIKLVVPVEGEGSEKSSENFELTLGDVVNIKEGKK
ncbi:TIGR00270 family protein [Sulfolobus sp. A20]|uniref:multiprotein bridging factor aMBF1 n=1 Tax=Saccharolobus sp. A20 TaxID=1891280 RepID=UPI0008460E74|nr:multiprotein bridging factor aMBF1 [Sulfolobus sp. A20]TRM76554.1 TIGR00270 family protein [Sulfolobus sp. B5]TRM77770.1 TIGR00270 family protein [Sulfolobus sp. A20-N-F8]TRM81431.1 TIGR00270 family protein [Sulfolobus sp. D5]TRM83919.1 TIGR00270 family protein [Sulfolobus sp. A20-N-F6]TRM88716.1 TIGR00270 family protein [Sulfolobus sp. C3]TRN00076.1 TIGR00270 family protein [Sulfolobus sp. F1]TRN03106.1 TIGR00270 family protein [Sulfolobus sp. E1]